MFSRLLTELLDKENDVDFVGVERHRIDRTYLMKLWNLLKSHFQRLGTCHGWVFVLIIFSYITKKVITQFFQEKNTSHWIFHLQNQFFTYSLFLHPPTLNRNTHTYIYACVQFSPECHYFKGTTSEIFAIFVDNHKWGTSVDPSPYNQLHLRPTFKLTAHRTPPRKERTTKSRGASDDSIVQGKGIKEKEIPKTNSLVSKPECDHRLGIL